MSDSLRAFADRVGIRVYWLGVRISKFGLRFVDAGRQW